MEYKENTEIIQKHIQNIKKVEGNIKETKETKKIQKKHKGLYKENIKKMKKT